MYMRLCYRYKRSEERSILNQAMTHLLQLCYQRCVQLLPDQSEASNLLQKQILKIFYAYIQVIIIEILSAAVFKNQLNAL